MKMRHTYVYVLSTKFPSVSTITVTMTAWNFALLYRTNLTYTKTVFR